MTAITFAGTADPEVPSGFRRALTRLLDEGGYICGWSEAPGPGQPAIQVALSRAEPPQRVSAELTLAEGSPRSAVWQRVDDPPVNPLEGSREGRHTWRFDCALGASCDADALYRELAEALGDGTSSGPASSVRFEYSGLAPGRAQTFVRWVIAPGLVASMALLGVVLLVAAGATAERAVWLATSAAIVGLGSTVLPRRLVAQLARRWPRLREGALADGVIFASLLALPIAVMSTVLPLLSILAGIS